MQDFQKTLLTSIVTAVAVMMITALYMLPRFEERTAANYEYVIKSIDSYNANQKLLSESNQELAKSNNEIKIDLAVIKNNIEFVKEIANTKVKTIEARMGVLEYRVGDRKKRED